MTKLKLKALIYRYGGPYLADQDEPLGTGLDRALWQVENGFTRPMAPAWITFGRVRAGLLGKRTQSLYILVEALYVFCTSLKWDLERLISRQK